jgi:hypothetical protein
MQIRTIGSDLGKKSSRSGFHSGQESGVLAASERHV